MFDALKVEDVCYCTLSEVNITEGILKGKEPILGKLSWTVELNLNEKEK